MSLTLDDIRKAQVRIRDVAYRTPLYHSEAFSKMVGCNVYFKLECLQPIRVFKIRGATNKVKVLLEQGHQGPVVAFSSGNHGTAVAYVTKKLGLKSTVIVPEWAVEEKVQAIREYGSHVIQHGKTTADMLSKVHEIQSKTGAAFIHPFADPDVIAGQGTIGLEIVEDLPTVDTVIVPIGGGGLISGISTAVKNLKPDVRVFGVQAQGSTAVYQAFKTGKIVTVEPDTIADGLRPTATVETCVQLIRRYVDDILLVSDSDIKSALREFICRAHFLAEASGVAPLAAILSGKYRPVRADENVVLVISGGNVRMDLLREVLS